MAILRRTSSPMLVPIMVRGTNRKPICDFLLVNTNLPPVLHIFKLWPIIGQIFAIYRGVPHFNALARGDSSRISGKNFTFPETTMILLHDTEDCTFVSSFIGQNTGTRWTDRRTDRQNLSGYYSGLYWEHCGYALKKKGRTEHPHHPYDSRMSASLTPTQEYTGANTINFCCVVTSECLTRFLH